MSEDLTICCGKTPHIETRAATSNPKFTICVIHCTVCQRAQGGSGGTKARALSIAAKRWTQHVSVKR